MTFLCRDLLGVVAFPENSTNIIELTHRCVDIELDYTRGGALTLIRNLKATGLCYIWTLQFTHSTR